MTLLWVSREGRLFFLAVALAVGFSAQASITNFVNFETAPVHPIALSPDHQILAVCNLPDNRVELFAVSNGIPRAIGSVAVGLDPVSARFASANELWVVNHISSSVSVIDVTAQRVVATLDTLPGPSDMVFAGEPRRAWISCSRVNTVLVIDPVSRAAVTNIVIQGERPRAMAVSPDGKKVYTAIFESGNGTTILSRRFTQLPQQPPPGPVDDPVGPHGGQNPPPNVGRNFEPSMNPSNRPAPRVGLIVRKNATGRWMDDNNGDWTGWVSGTNAASSGRVPGWDLPDRDVGMIDTSTLEVTYAHGLMNICMSIAVNPVSGRIAVVGTDAMNERRFEPVLKGIFLRVNLGLVDAVARTNLIRDLNPHLDYAARTLPHEQRALSIGDPRAIEWSADGMRAYVTGMGSRNMVILDAEGNRVNQRPIELGEGPTGIAVDDTRSRLYVWNRFSSSVSVVDATTGVVVTNISVFDPTPDIIRRGRRHLYDTRKTSGLGIASCASCHVDGRADRLAWDLGDPNGGMMTNRNFTFHPMKGPMVTQTFQDIITPFLSGSAGLVEQSLHWRGDRKNLEEFNPTFTALQGNDVELTTNEMAEFKGMLATIFFPPNFYRTVSNTLPVSMPLPGHYGRAPTNGGPSVLLPPGNALNGRGRFGIECGLCHALLRGGRASSNNEMLVIPRAGPEGAFKISQLRSLGDKVGMSNSTTNGRAGFGYLHDGRVDTLTRFLVDGFPATSFTNDQAIADMVAFLLCFTGSDFPPGPNFSQDVPAATGKQITFASPTPPAFFNTMTNLARWPTNRLDLIVRGRKEGLPRSWLFNRLTGQFVTDSHGKAAQDLAAILDGIATGNEFTATLVPLGSGVRLALDRDGDGFFDATEIEGGSDPANPALTPNRILSVSKTGTDVTLRWESLPGLRYTVQWRSTFPNSSADGWNTLTADLVGSSTTTSFIDRSPNPGQRRFYRVRIER